MIPYKQLSLNDILGIAKINQIKTNQLFFSLLETHIDIDEIIPVSSGTISMHQRAEPVNTLYTPFYGT